MTAAKGEGGGGSAKKKKSKLITPRDEDYNRWYTDVVLQSELADYSPVKGCMVIRPDGYGLWEQMRDVLDRMFRDTGHRNAYFPLFIPESFLQKEAEHVEGFAPECAVVTHGGGKKLEEPLVVRPTSETIMYSMFAKWIMSYRDLPLKLNQWANIVRWEMRTRLFLRTTEFLWQEGHTAHETHEQSETEVMDMLEVYARFAEDYMAVPVIKGTKTDKEKFAGALSTYCVEAMMQDRRALQAGTTHDLGQNFARAFDVKFQDREGKMAHVWQTSWGVSTRLIGAIVMAHGDDAGLVLPPRLAPVQVVIVPIWRGDDQQALVGEKAEALGRALRDAGVRTEVDLREQYKPGYKFSHWELKGVPLRLELGPRDMEAGQVFAARRDSGDKQPITENELVTRVPELLEEIQSGIFQKALAFREENTHLVDDYAEMGRIMEESCGFVHAHWCGSVQCEEKVQNETKASIRCIPFEPLSRDGEGEGACIVCGKTSPCRVIFDKAY